MHSRVPLILCLSFAFTGALRTGAPSGVGDSCFFDGGTPLEPGLGEPDDVSSSRLPELSVQQEFLAQIKALPEIPKLLHIAFPSHDVVKSETDMAKYGIRQMIDLNPDWTWKVWNDTEVDAFIKPRVSSEDWRLLEACPQIERIDLWRLLVLYCEGGFYQDVDRLYDIPMAEILKPETRMLLPQGPGNFAQDVMCTAPGNPVFDIAIKLNLARRRAARFRDSEGSSGHVIDLGPVVYNHAISKALFGVMMSAGDQERQARLFELVRGLEPYVLTKKESWCHLIVSEYPNDDCKWISREPLYLEFSHGHWDRKLQ